MLRIGIDIIEISRFEEVVRTYQDRFLQRIFTKNELIQVGNNIPSLAARFTAKEAVSKALHTGIGIVGWHDIEIVRGKMGEPSLKLYGRAAYISRESHLSNWTLSLTHTKNIAAAVAVAFFNPSLDNYASTFNEEA